MLALGWFRKDGARQRLQTTGQVDRDRRVVFTCPRPRDETERSRRGHRRHSRQSANVDEGQIEVRFRTGYDAARFRKEISRDHRKIEDWLGIDGLEHLGEKAWRQEVLYCVTQLKLSFVADTVVLGGGNVKKMKQLPRRVKKGDNRNAFLGGCRLWETDRKTGKPRWRIL